VLPNQNFAQIVIVTKDLKARERVKPARKSIADGALPEADARRPLHVRPPVGFPVQFSRDRARPDEGARSPRRCASHGDELKIVDAASRLERAGEVDRSSGPGPAPAPRPHAQDVAQTLQTLLTATTVTQFAKHQHIDVVARAVPANVSSSTGCGIDHRQQERRRRACRRLPLNYEYGGPICGATATWC